MSGYCGTILRVNLSASEIKKEDLDIEIAKKFIGGRGLGTYYLSKEVSPTIDPLSPDNKLLFATGPLTGTQLPASGRYMVITKSPLSGVVACSNSGGFWGAELKHAGYDMIIVEGKSEEPVYISINDEKVEIKSAKKYWGKLVTETTDLLLQDAEDPKSRVLTIGPAGEKQALLASIMNEKYRAAGRSGVGAVMGCKNLKAIVVRGTKQIEPADKDKIQKVLKDMLKKIKEHPVTSEGLPTNGTAGTVNVMNEFGALPTKNYQRSYHETAAKISGEVLTKDYLVKRVACYRCPVACGRRTSINGKIGEGPEYETIWAFGSDCGVDDFPAIIKANNYCNEYGLDTISAGATIACAMELYKKGFIKPGEIDGPPLEFGSSEAIVEWTRKMGQVEGFGAKLANGSYRLADEYGAPELSMSVKKLELPAYDPRGIQGQGLSYATSNRGGCHLRGYVVALEAFGLPIKINRFTTEEKGYWVKFVQDKTAAIDSLGLCIFISFALDNEDYKDMFNGYVGEDWTTEKLFEAGERIWNLERIFNLKAGVGPEQDTLPRRLLTEPVPEGSSKGHVNRLAEMLPDYYQQRGWDEKGIPTESKLAQLGIK